MRAEQDAAAGRPGPVRACPGRRKTGRPPHPVRQAFRNVSQATKHNRHAVACLDCGKLFSANIAKANEHLLPHFLACEAKDSAGKVRRKRIMSYPVVQAAIRSDPKLQKLTPLQLASLPAGGAGSEHEFGDVLDEALMGPDEAPAGKHPRARGATRWDAPGVRASRTWRTSPSVLLLRVPAARCMAVQCKRACIALCPAQCTVCQRRRGPGCVLCTRPRPARRSHALKPNGPGLPRGPWRAGCGRVCLLARGSSCSIVGLGDVLWAPLAHGLHPACPIVLGARSLPGPMGLHGGTSRDSFHVARLDAAWPGTGATPWAVGGGWDA